MRDGRETGMEDFSAGPEETCKPELGADRIGVRRSASEYSSPETPVISANDIKKRRSGIRFGVWKRKTSSGQSLPDVCDRDFDAVFVRQSSLPALSDLKRPGKRGCIFRSRTSFVRNIRKRRSKKKEKKQDAL